MVIFFSSVITFLYFIGAMQGAIKVIARVMQVTMTTSPTESLNAAGNIFVGQVSHQKLLII